MVMKQQRKGQQQKHDRLMETKQQRKGQPKDRVMDENEIITIATIRSKTTQKRNYMVNMWKIQRTDNERTNKMRR